MKNKSIWESTANETSKFKTFTGDIETDVAIIGGSVAGLTIALLLSDEGKKVIVIEPGELGWDVINSTGHLHINEEHNIQTNGKKSNGAVKALTSALDLIEKNAQRFDIDCEFTRTSLNYYAEPADKKGPEHIKEKLDALTKDGIKAKVLGSYELPFKVTSMLSIEQQAQYHPFNYVKGLAGGLSARCEIYENTPVTEIDEKEGIIKTKGGKIKAKIIVMASTEDSKTKELSSQQCIATELDMKKFPPGMFTGTQAFSFTFNSFSTKGKEYLILSGPWKTASKSASAKDDLKPFEEFIKDRFETKTFTHHWNNSIEVFAKDPVEQKDKLYSVQGVGLTDAIHATAEAIRISGKILAGD